MKANRRSSADMSAAITIAQEIATITRKIVDDTIFSVELLPAPLQTLVLRRVAEALQKRAATRKRP